MQVDLHLAEKDAVRQADYALFEAKVALFIAEHGLVEIGDWFYDYADLDFPTCHIKTETQFRSIDSGSVRPARSFTWFPADGGHWYYMYQNRFSGEARFYIELDKRHPEPPEMAGSICLGCYEADKEHNNDN